MDHNEAVRKFEHLMIREADHAHEAATELEALVSLLPSEKSRQLASKGQSQTSQGLSRASAESQRKLGSRAFAADLCQHHRRRLGILDSSLQ
jgi:hypothetical protein